MTTLSKLQTIYHQEGLRSAVTRSAAKAGWLLYDRFAPLPQLGARCGTDKGDPHHTFRGLSYLHIYEQYFRSRRRQRLNILEIGVLGGNSLRMWKRYFRNAQIFGLDIDPNAKRHEEERISITIGSQSDERTLAEVSRKAGHFDIVIDDGSHVNHHMIASFEHLFPRLSPGGIYALEDLGGSYHTLEDDGVREHWPGMKYNDPTDDLNNRREDMDRFFLGMVHDMDRHRGDIMSVQFWPYMCVLLKAGSSRR
jgi:hypothetical protein